MKAHLLRKRTGAYGHFCPSPLQDAPSVYPTPCGHRQRDWALPQARARSSYHAQRNQSQPVFQRQTIVTQQLLFFFFHRDRSIPHRQFEHASDTRPANNLHTHKVEMKKN